MIMTPLELQDASTAYDVLGPAYDLLGDASAHDRWLDSLLQVAVEHGLRSRRALDVACGTGRSFLPLVRRGYDVVACDISPRMVELARTACCEAAEVHVADMRSLPVYGQFALVTCLNDAINHLTSARDVVAAFDGMRSNLSRDGLVVFDVNTIAAYGSRGDLVAEDADRFVAWRATQAPTPAPGGQTAVLVEVFTRRSDGAWDRATSHQPHRHYPVAQIARLLEEAGLQVLAMYGQRRGGVLDPVLDEECHHKALFVAARMNRDNDRRQR